MITSTVPTHDAVALELLSNALASITDEMAITIYRTARSGIVKDILDFTVAVCDADGRMVGQGATLALHLGSIPGAMAAVRRAVGAPRPGDVYIMNDPYDGGVHLPDVFIVKPVFAEEDHLGYTLAVAHQTDMGGRVAGSNATDSLEIFEEGLRLPPVRLVDAGTPNEPLFKIIESNVRLPALVLGDLRAQLAACEVGAAEFARLWERFPDRDLRQSFTDLLDYTERLARAQISSWPDGVYRFEDFLDSNGVAEEPVRLRVALTVAGDELHADFEGTDDQVAAAINCPVQVTRSVVYAAVRCVMDGDIPNNDGYFRPITVDAPVGSVLNMQFPAACAARGATAYRLTDTLLGALAEILPGRVPAACEGGVHLLTLGGYEEGAAFVVNDIVCGTGGARPHKDGVDGIANPIVNLANTPVEVEEQEGPVLVEEYVLVPDTGGPGRHRGGLAIARTIRFTGGEARCQVRGDRRAHPPWGLDGGLHGRPSTNELIRGGRLSVLGSMQNFALDTGDMVRIQTAGGGGFGDPLDRDPEDVLADAIEGKVTLDHARAMYGVHLSRNGVNLALDADATADARAAMRQSAS